MGTNRRDSFAGLSQESIVRRAKPLGSGRTCDSELVYSEFRPDEPLDACFRWQVLYPLASEGDFGQNLWVANQTHFRSGRKPLPDGEKEVDQ